MTIDLLPTIAGVTGTKAPADRMIDGRDIWPLLTNTRGAESPHDALYFYWGQELHAVRSGRWKLHLPHPYQALDTPGSGGMPGKYVRREIELSLFDLRADPGESTNVAGRNPDVVKRLMEYVERAREDLGDSLTKRDGKNVRPAGKAAPLPGEAAAARIGRRSSVSPDRAARRRESPSSRNRPGSTRRSPRRARPRRARRTGGPGRR
jgi:hypothetical protein